MAHDLHRNQFAVDLLRHLVFMHLYLFPVPLRTRQRVCQKLNITHNTPALLASGEKKGRL